MLTQCFSESNICWTVVLFYYLACHSSMLSLPSSTACPLNTTIFCRSWKILWSREFPGSPVVRTWSFHCQGLGSVPGQGTKILQAMWHGKNKTTTTKRYDDWIKSLLLSLLHKAVYTVAQSIFKVVSPHTLLSLKRPDLPWATLFAHPYLHSFLFPKPLSHPCMLLMSSNKSLSTLI